MYDQFRSAVDMMENIETYFCFTVSGKLAIWARRNVVTSLIRWWMSWAQWCRRPVVKWINLPCFGRPSVFWRTTMVWFELKQLIFSVCSIDINCFYFAEISIRSKVHDIDEDWKPSFLSNEEFMHLILEAFDGFIVVFSSCGRILYTSGNITSLLGYLPVSPIWCN